MRNIATALLKTCMNCLKKRINNLCYKFFYTENLKIITNNDLNGKIDRVSNIMLMRKER